MRYDDYDEDYEYSRPKKRKRREEAYSEPETPRRKTKTVKSVKSGRKTTAYYDFDSTEEEFLRGESRTRRNEQKQSTTGKKKRKRRKWLPFVIGLEFILLAAICVCLWVVNKFDTIQRPNWGKLDVERNEDIAPEISEQMKTGYTDIMVFGVDAASTLEGGSGADVNILIHINNETGEIKMVSFYRDLYLNMGSNSFKKLTDIYRSDGAFGALGALNTNLDLNIDQFVTVNWEMVAQVINSLGGIDIMVPKEMMSEINGYITETVNVTGIGSYQLKSSGYQHLDGIQTVAFCRIRHMNVPGYSIGDYGRSERQREVLGLLLEKAKKTDIGTLVSIADYVFPNIYSNVELLDVMDMIKSITKYHVAAEDGTLGFPFHQTSASVSASVVYSLDHISDVQELHEHLYGTEDGYEVSGTVQNIANKLYSIPGITR